MNQIVKICGLSTPDAVRTACDSSATHLGFIFFPKSPRNISPELAASLCANKKTAKSVAVSVNADDEFLDHIVTIMKPNLLQLHGSESIERVSQIKDKYGLSIIKALAVHDVADLEKAQSYAEVADMLLLDAKPPKGSQLPGGNGVSFDWSLLEGLQTNAPVLLSGGIGLENVEMAMQQVRDRQNSISGLDVSSGVESAPGVKDIPKIRAFLAACQ